MAPARCEGARVREGRAGTLAGRKTARFNGLAKVCEGCEGYTPART